MAYIGRPSIVGNFVKLDAISVVNGQAAYTMQNGGANFTDYGSVNQFLVSLNGTIQAPTDSFTVSGSTLTFASNLSTGDVIDFIMVFGNSLSAGTPTDGTVTAAKLNDDIISGQTALASEPADTDEFLVSDAGTLKRIDYSLIKGGGLTEADQFRLSASISAGTNADITSNLERIDTTGSPKVGTGMSESSGIFTFPSTGIYLVNVHCVFSMNANDAMCYVNTLYTANNSSYVDGAYAVSFNKTASATNQSACSSLMVDVTDTSNVKIKFATVSMGSGTSLSGNTDINYTTFTFLKLGDT